MDKQPDEQLTQLKNKALRALAEVSAAPELEAWRIAYLGRKGAIPQYLRRIKDLSPEKRRIIGRQGNELRHNLEEQYKQKKQETASTAAASPLLSEPAIGHLHPLTLSIRRIQDILTSLGFTSVEGPLVEESRYNFDLLNIPLQHPARADTDTFYLKNGRVLRTHTSPVQLRAVLEQGLAPPFKIFSPGRTFRAERTDASHDATFHQFEGLAVGKDITIADFKGIIAAFMSEFFSAKATIRLRPSFFPFVEPGFEVDVSCVFCKQKGCRICKHTGWVEIMGAGMVHPNVLRNMNIDHKQFQGFAFGGAIDRLTMLRHNISDIRLFWSGDFKFLKQFS